MVRKKYGGVRMCVDLCRLNLVTKFDCFSLSRLDEALNAFAGAIVFCSLDLAMAYHQVLVTPVNVKKTAFITQVGRSKWQRCRLASAMRRRLISA